MACKSSHPHLLAIGVAGVDIIQRASSIPIACTLCCRVTLEGTRDAVACLQVAVLIETAFLGACLSAQYTRQFLVITTHAEGVAVGAGESDQ